MCIDNKERQQQLLSYVGSHVLDVDLSELTHMPWPVSFDILLAVQSYARAHPHAEPALAPAATAGSRAQHSFVPGVKSPRPSDAADLEHAGFALGGRRPPSQNEV